MASKKKESEGIALLSMYNDEDEEMEDTYKDDVDDQEELVHSDRPVSDSALEPTPPSLHQSQHSHPMEDSSPLKTDKVPAPTPTLTPTPPPQLWSYSPPQQVVPPLFTNPALDSQRTRKQALAIVDYAHDETTLSPEAEEGEIMGTGHVVFGDDLQSIMGNSEEDTPHVPVTTVPIVLPTAEATIPQPSGTQQPSQSDSSPTMNYDKMESMTAGTEEAVMVSIEIQKNVDPLENFLPPPPKTKCSDELREKINKFLALKRAGKSFNAEVRNRKDYRNPDFLQHAVTYQDIDQIGSCFSKDVFDPHGYDKSDFYDEIESDMKREMERKEQEKKRNQKVEFVTGGTQPGMMGMAPKTGMQIPVAPTVAASGLHPLPTAADFVARDNRQSKKSKWDKVDGDRKNPLQAGGQDAISTAATHTSLISAANAGSGYTAFAQQKRREAEERRCSDKKR